MQLSVARSVGRAADLRIGDLPHNLALAYPRTITFVGQMPKEYTWTRQLYQKLGAASRLRQIDSMRQWEPATAP